MDETVREAEWKRWLETHAPGFLLFARQKARWEADAEDLVQEALVEACGRVEQDGGCPPPAALVYATIRRRAIDLARREDRRAAREHAVLGVLSEAWFDTSVEDRELSARIQSSMSQLPEMYREVITLKLWGDLTFGEIGEALGLSPNTAASRYRYGLAELRKLTKGVLV
jgi:RNA polymerase sigma-70 factor (ECF subfamily)